MVVPCASSRGHVVQFVLQESKGEKHIYPIHSTEKGALASRVSGGRVGETLHVVNCCSCSEREQVVCMDRLK